MTVDFHVLLLMSIHAEQPQFDICVEINPSNNIEFDATVNRNNVSQMYKLFRPLDVVLINFVVNESDDLSD